MFQAGFKHEQCRISLEPEAASIFCQYLPVERFSVGGTVKFSESKAGTTYMIVDLGGKSCVTCIYLLVVWVRRVDVYTRSKLADIQRKTVFGQLLCFIWVGNKLFVAKAHSQRAIYMYSINIWIHRSLHALHRCFLVPFCRDAH